MLNVKNLSIPVVLLFAAMGKRRRVKGRHHLPACRTQRDMRAAVRRRGRHLGAMIEPELRISLAEGDRCGTRLEPRIAERREHFFIEARSAFEIADRDGDVVDHVKPLRGGRARPGHPRLRSQDRRGCPRQARA